MLNWVGMGADVVGAVDWARTLRDTCAGASAAAAARLLHRRFDTWHLQSRPQTPKSSMSFAPIRGIERRHWLRAGVSR